RLRRCPLISHGCRPNQQPAQFLRACRLLKPHFPAGKCLFRLALHLLSGCSRGKSIEGASAMKRPRKVAALAAAMMFAGTGVAGSAGIARASDELTLKPMYFDDAAPATPSPPPPKPLTEGLNALGMKEMPFSIYGFIEGSYTY